MKQFADLEREYEFLNDPADIEEEMTNQEREEYESTILEHAIERQERKRDERPR